MPTDKPWRRRGWDAYVHEEQAREAMERAGDVDEAFGICFACRESVLHAELNHGYCTIESPQIPHTPCASERAFIAEGECIGTSDKALQIRVSGKEAWIPRSLFCKGNTLRDPGDQGIFIVRRWIAEKKGLV